jgi:hypothetical protein
VNHWKKLRHMVGVVQESLMKFSEVKKYEAFRRLI